MQCLYLTYWLLWLETAKLLHKTSKIHSRRNSRTVSKLDTISHRKSQVYQYLETSYLKCYSFFSCWRTPAHTHNDDVCGLLKTTDEYASLVLYRMPGYIHVKHANHSCPTDWREITKFCVIVASQMNIVGVICGVFSFWNLSSRMKLGVFRLKLY